MLRELFEETLERLLAAVRTTYGADLVSLVIFGSVARGTPSPESDVDLLVVAKNLPSGRITRVDRFEQVEHMLAPWLADLRDRGVNTFLSPVFKTPEEVQIGSLLFLDLVTDARFLYDEDGFFETYLAKLRNRLKELGARRIQRGSSWHWVLKPDLRPGEVFDLWKM